MSEYFIHRLLIKVPTQIRWPQYFKSPLLTVRSRLTLPQISLFRYIVLKLFFCSHVYRFQNYRSEKQISF